MKLVLLFSLVVLSFAAPTFLGKQDSVGTFDPIALSMDNIQFFSEPIIISDPILEHHIDNLMDEEPSIDQITEFVEYVAVDGPTYTSAEKIRSLLHNQRLKSKPLSALGSYTFNKKK